MDLRSALSWPLPTGHPGHPAQQLHTVGKGLQNTRYKAADLSLDSNPDGRAQVHGAPGLLPPLGTGAGTLQVAVVTLLSEGRKHM